MQSIKHKVVVSLMIFGMFSCTSSGTESQVPEGEKIIAKAGSDVLTEKVFLDNYISDARGKDSAEKAKQSIEAWATEALFYQEAIGKLEEEEIDINRQVEDYRRTLVNYIYQTKLIEANLDTLVSKEEIQEYYNAHRDNFILKENIIKVNYFKVPLKATALNKMKKLVWSQNPKDKEALNNLVSQNAENYYLNDSAWLFLEDVKKEIPALREQPDFSLNKGKILEFTDDLYYYFLKVKDVKIKNALSPLSFEYANIRKFIINNRKTQLIKLYKHTLLEKAMANKNFTIN